MRQQQLDQQWQQYEESCQQQPNQQNGIQTALVQMTEMLSQMLRIPHVVDRVQMSQINVLI